MIDALVLDVVDGDTIKVRANPWPQVFIETSIRVDGVDTPELRGKCAEERAKAADARSFLTLAVKGKRIGLLDVRPDKYGGRYDARVILDGRDLGQILIEAGLARPYAGGARGGWCG